MWYVPRKLRAKMDLRWRLGIVLGQSGTSNENVIRLPNGSVVKCRAVNRVVQSGRWHSQGVLGVKGYPGKPTISPHDVDFDSVEASASPHANADADNVDREADSSVPVEVRQRAPALDRQVRITRKDLEKFGYEPECPRCEDLQAGRFKSKRNHSDVCRLRMYCHFQATNDPKWRAIAGNLDYKDKSPNAEGEALDFDILDSDFNDPPDRELDPPAENPATPLSHAQHFEPPAGLASGMEEDEKDSDDVEAVDPSFPDLMDDDDEAGACAN